MKKHLILLSLLYCTVGYGQKQKDTIYLQDKIVPKGIDANTGKVYYGFAGLQQEKPSDTLKRYYFHKYIFFMDRMNETNGRTSARFQDSVERYYKLLYPKR